MEENISYIIFTDNGGNNYGILKVETTMSDTVVTHILNNIIIDTFKTQENFFNDFSGNLSIVISELDKQDYIKVIDFIYNESFMFNVDKVDFGDLETNYTVEDYLLNRFIETFGDENLSYKDNIKELEKSNKLTDDYMMRKFKDTYNLEELREIFEDMDNDEFVDFMGELGFTDEELEGYTDLEDIEDLEQQLYYLEGIITEYETKGRGDKQSYVWALGEIGKVKSKIAELEG